VLAEEGGAEDEGDPFRVALSATFETRPKGLVEMVERAAPAALL